jgi:tetratricopeptide (TPR) repeat protein
LRDLDLKREPRMIERRLKLIENASLPKNFDALRHLAVALSSLDRKDTNDAVKALERAQLINPDLPRVILASAILYGRLGNLEKSAKYLQEFEDRFGDDSLTCRLRGATLMDLGRREEAAVAYRKALDQNPDDSEAFFGLVRCLEPGEARDDLGARFAKLSDGHVHFDKLVRTCLDLRDGETLRDLAAAMKRADPKHPRPIWRWRWARS